MEQLTLVRSFFDVTEQATQMGYDPNPLWVEKASQIHKTCQVTSPSSFYTLAMWCPGLTQVMLLPGSTRSNGCGPGKVWKILDSGCVVSYRKKALPGQRHQAGLSEDEPEVPAHRRDVWKDGDGLEPVERWDVHMHVAKSKHATRNARVDSS
eukprot:3707459-Rhodomonas_salina.1